MRMALWATEKAKIELSSRTDAVIAASESELRVRDQAGSDIYLDVPVTRRELDSLIANELSESVEAGRETIEKAGLSAHDIERIIFVGGPTQYAPLRTKVAGDLGIAPSRSKRSAAASAS
jgi:molecular chaperone DnaK